VSRISWSTVVGVLAALFLGRCTADLPPPPVITQTFVDTVAPAEMMRLIEDGALENFGLKAKLAGHVRVEPVYILHTDTVVTPPDTVLQMVRLYANGGLTLAPLIRTDSLYKPELHHLDVSKCDDGWSWASGELICDRARFGHLSAYAEAGAEANPFGPPLPTAAVHAGLAWAPCYRCGTRVSVGTDQRGRLSLEVRRSWMLF
jgi:hypothetical protein